jgi:hypothetical protein
LIAQVWTAVLLGVAVVGGGAGMTSFLARRVPMPTATRLAMVGAAGLTFVGVVTLVIGHLHLLGPWLSYALALAGILLGVLGRHELVESVSRGWRGVVGQFRTHPVPLAAVSLGLAVAAFATLVPPSRRDEVDYHWPAPLDWAANGGWSDSPFRHVDAFPFMEVIYTAAATQGSYVAAHLLHFGAFLTLGFAVAGVAGSMGVRGTGVTAAAALAMPVVWDSAYAAYNDTPVGAFSVLAVGVVLAAPRASLAAVGIASGLIVVATSIKPTGIAAVGVVALVILMRYLFGVAARRRGPDDVIDQLGAAPTPARAGFGRVAMQWLILAIPSALTLAFWSVRQYLYTGNLLDPAVTAEPDEFARTMLPNAVEQALAPLIPFVSGLIGSVEPWGGRTGLVIQIFLIPALVYVIWRRGAVLRRFLLMVVPAWAHWIVLGLAIVRTRFHVASWAMMIVGLRVAVEDFSERFPRARIWVEIAWTIGILIGMADVSVEMFRHLGAWLAA